MESQILWFIAGVAVAVGIGLGVWSFLSFVQNRRMKRQLNELMHDNGSLAMQVSILKDALKAKETYDQEQIV